jgi:hypothetical protein
MPRGEFDPDKLYGYSENTMNIFSDYGCGGVMKCAIRRVRKDRIVWQSSKSPRQHAEILAKEKESAYAACGT